MTISPAQLFDAVAQRLEASRAALNQADTINGNHGDHMVEIFSVAGQTARQRSLQDFPAALAEASQQLAALSQNGTAQVYARGLAQFAQQLAASGIGLEDLAPYIRGLLTEGDASASNEQPTSQAKVGGAEVLRALAVGLQGWQQSEASNQPSADPAVAPPAPRLDMGYLFELGVAYMQAKQRGGTKAEVLADAAASLSPLKNVPHRYQSGKLALQTLLQTIAQS